MDGNKIGRSRGVKINVLMRRAVFVRGFSDKRTKLAFCDEYDTWSTNTQFTYERGRMLAACCPNLKAVLTPRGRVCAAALRGYRENNQPEGRIII